MYDLAINFPIHNEEESITEVLNEWMYELDQSKIDYCLVLSEDGSNDKTKSILSKFITNNKRAVNNVVEKKRGYTGAVISGIQIADAKYILCVDSDGQCDPKDFMKFWNKRFEISDGVMIGNRKNRKDSYLRLLCSKFFSIFHFLMFPHKIKDPSCPYILFEKRIVEKIYIYLNYVDEAFWWLFIAACIKNKIKIYQTDINHRKRFYGITQVYKFSKFPIIFIKNLLGLIKLRLAK
jgi:dolichol-phosphate mannosyltransferase